MKMAANIIKFSNWKMDHDLQKQLYADTMNDT